MSIDAARVTRVIVAGDWISVKLGTFEVIDYEFVDEHGNPLNRSREPAYSFISTAGDPYCGPLSAIQLIKLLSESQLVEQTDTQPAATIALGTGDEEPVHADGATSVASSLFAEPEGGRSGGLLSS